VIFHNNPWLRYYQLSVYMWNPCWCSKEDICCMPARYFCKKTAFADPCSAMYFPISASLFFCCVIIILNCHGPSTIQHTALVHISSLHLLLRVPSLTEKKPLQGLLSWEVLEQWHYLESVGWFSWDSIHHRLRWHHDKTLVEFNLVVWWWSDKPPN